MNVEYRRFDPSTAEPEQLAELVTCYINVFAEPPWHEYKKCLVCGRTWGKKDGPELQAMLLRHCGQNLADYWPRDEVEAEIRHAVDEIGTCWIAVDEIDGTKSIVGFTWGYPASKRQSKSEIEVEEAIRTCFGADVDFSRVAYLAELAVLSTHRGRSVARGLVQRRHQDFLDRGFTGAVLKVREHPEPSVTYLWYRRLGFHVAHRYQDGRVVLVCDLHPDLFR